MKQLKLLLICVLSTLLIICCSLLWPRFLYQEGINQFKLKNYTQAIDHFKRAEQAMPKSIENWFAQADLFRIYTNHGQALYQLAIKEWKEQGLSPAPFDILLKAKSYLDKADKIEPEHYINSYWLTRTYEGLEKAYAWLYPKKNNPYNADTFYQKALNLRPAGITVRYAYVRYLQYKGLKAKIPELVQYMMEIHPPSYRNLKKEDFYTDDLLPYIEQGLHQAIAKEILPRDALKALADIYATKNDFEKSISYYTDLLNHTPSSNSYYDHIHMGQLYLKNKQYEKGFDAFKKSLLLTENSNSTINRIYTVFKREKLFEKFLNFSVYLQENNLGNRNLDMLVARCWIDKGQPQLGKARLIQIIAAEPYAPAYYLLAQTAQKEKDWDQMEIASQKATRLDPDNPYYYYLLSQALNNQKKYAHAEEVATKTIQHSPKENSNFYNYRAWTRWSQKKYADAAEDWKKAFSINHKHSGFAYRIALAHEQEGLFKEGLAYIQKAIDLAPDKQNYKDLQKRLLSHK
ncbi:tetratricopeptide repeat protein [Desulfobacula toluolica]|uniref:Tetratricopeptide repeat protein, presursor n=1 Tax=Desulfobacula toluolica (strain DSM 7467 / Tol2) TaxID=651182 RepID=K0NGP4_DESTT|nr:tetratricopeptide repeat protein [Desulfobacula toluolica]CCK79018.1 tetratricopeptide repeat protein, presursor [Desulfobacula toluolica Tol2]